MLTQLATLKARINPKNPQFADDDAFLSRAIGAVSDRFEKECNRLFKRTEGATYEFDADVCAIIPNRYPIESVASFDLKTTESEGWVAQTGVEYLIMRSAVINLLAPLGGCRQVGRVTYTGGFVLPGTTAEDGQTALSFDLENACIEQCVYWHQRRNQLGLVSVSAEGGSIQNFSQLDLLPQVKSVLKSYKRFTL